MLIVTGASGQLGRKIIDNLLLHTPAERIGVSVRVGGITTIPRAWFMPGRGRNACCLFPPTQLRRAGIR